MLDQARDSGVTRRLNNFIDIAVTLFSAKLYNTQYNISTIYSTTYSTKLLYCRTGGQAQKTEQLAPAETHCQHHEALAA